MRFFSGFLLKDEQALFASYLKEGDLVVAGFSYGAQKALEYALQSKERIDRLILLSPAFFQDRDAAFKRAQKLYFSSHKERYIKEFFKNVLKPNKKDLSIYFKDGTKEELDALLEYEWEEDKLSILQERGVMIEVFLGEKDAIVNANSALEFFSKNNITLYLIKDAGHLL